MAGRMRAEGEHGSRLLVGWPCGWMGTSFMERGMQEKLPLCVTRALQ